MKKRGQVSIEMVFIVGALFLILLTILSFVFDKKIETNRIEQIIEIKKECNKLADIMMNVFLSGNGTRIGSFLYFNASTDSGNRLISVYDDFITCTLPINQFTDVVLDRVAIILENKNNFVHVQNV